METTVNGNAYKIKVLPIELSPYTMLYAELVKQKPKDVAEAEKIREQLKQIVKTVLAETVSPSPPPEDTAELFSFVTTYTAQKIEEQTKLFRRPEQPSSTESGRARFTAENSPK
jgi:hypothetical protein